MSSSNTIVKHVDIEAVLKTKNPSLYKWLPGFLLRYIKRTLHEDEINIGMEKYKDVHGADFAQSTLTFMGAKAESIGLENVPETGGVIICSNHPLGGLDGVALINVLAAKRKDIRFLVNDILLFFKNFGEVFVPVNKIGDNTKDALAKIESIYASDNAVLVFPAGLVSRKTNGVIKDLEWKKSFVAKAQAYKKPIIPTFIEGRNRNFFYNLANWRKRLGVKANIEMFYLCDEMFNQKGKAIRIHFGKPIAPETFDNSKRKEVWAQLLREYVYEIGKGTKLSFEEFVKANENK